MTMQQKLAGVAFTLPNMPILVSYIDGFIGEGMVDLHLCDGADTLASVSNRNPGGPVTAIVAPGTPSVASLLANGGVHMEANAYWPTAQDIDITEAFTFMWHGSVNIPIAGGTQWSGGIISVNQYSTRGFNLYSFANNVYPLDSTQVGAVARYVINGVQQSVNTLTPSPGWTYGDKVTFITRSDGINLNHIVMKDGAKLVDFSYAPDFTGMTTNAAVQDKTMKMTAGQINASFAKGIIDVEGVVSYQRRLSDSELRINDNKFKLVRTGRGR